MNILLIHSDQHRHDCIGAHGLRAIHTPHLDQLVREGATFSRAYSTIPICTPARASLATGAWPSTHGSLCIPTSELKQPAHRDLPTIFKLLKNAGYRTAWCGKYHGELETASWEPGPTEHVDEFVGLHRYKQYREPLGIPEEVRTHGLFGDENTTQPSDKTSVAWQADTIIRLLDQAAAPAADGSTRPFFVRWDPPEPHPPYRPASEFVARYDAASIPPWPSFPDTLEGKPSLLRRQRDIWGLNNWDWSKWAPIVRLYYGAVTELDHHIGRVLAHLEKIGRAHDTLVIYSTDHGDFAGGHGLYDKHFSFYEDIARVPLVVRAPDRIRPGTTCDAFASGSIDIARTILAAAGVDAPQTFVGHDLVAMAADGSRPRDVAYAQYFGTESGVYSCRMLRDDRYKFVYHPTGDTNELYDLHRDPGELRNLVHDPAHADALVRLKSRLFDEMKACGDRLANLWTETELKGAPPISARCGL